MFTECVLLFTRAFAAGIDWFTDVFGYSGMAGPWLAVFFLGILSHYILAPLFGAARRIGASDTVRNIRKIKNKKEG